MWLRSRTFQKMGGGFWEQLGLNLYSSIQMLSLSSRKSKEHVDLIRRARRERKCLNSAWECYNLLSFARAMTRLPGAYAEVGCYQGATAKIICEMKGDKPLLLFDTFEGLPRDGDHDPGVHRTGEYACSLANVQNYLGAYDNVSYHKGVFPDSAREVPEQEYAFVHFDVDLYEGTLACLEYFYPRMTPGGILVSHDYSMLEGVEKAFHDFMHDKPEPLLPLGTTQVILIKHASAASEVTPASTAAAGA
ncbi:MAG: class I SAM-dependent methyltransferase [Planctomycetales bacterium]|nr:class I SAM-dependent methyltransferase [Planctomycetales bacterium]